MTRMNNKKLTGILAAFGVVIVGLVAGIIIVRLNSKSVPEELDCSLLASDIEQRECLREANDDEKQEVVDAIYEEVFKEALNNKNYYYYTDTLNDKASMLVADGKCNEAIETLANAQLSDLSNDDLAYYYSFARDISMMCGEEMKAEEYGRKYQEMVDSGQVTISLPSEAPIPDESLIEENVEMMEEG